MSAPDWGVPESPCSRARCSTGGRKCCCWDIIRPKTLPTTRRPASTSDVFFEGNPYFYKDGERRKWRIWTKLYDAMREVGYTEPMEDGNFVFMNAVYFGSRSIAQLERIPGAVDAAGRCLDFTREVIQDIFKPRCVICLSIPNCYNYLDRRFHFSGRMTLVPERMRQGVHIVSRHAVTKADWEGIPVYGIPHPSGCVDNDSWGAIAQYLKDELTNPNILYT